MILDTSFLFALFFDRDELFYRASEDSLKIKNEDWLIPDTVLEELFTITSYKVGIKDANEIIEKILLNRQISIYETTQQEKKEIFALARKKMQKLSFTDYSLIYLFLLTGEKVLTYDKQLSKLLVK